MNHDGTVSNPLSTPCESFIAVSSLHTPGPNAMSTPNTSPRITPSPHASLNVSSPFAPSYTSSVVCSGYMSPGKTDHCSSPYAPKARSPSGTTIHKPDEDSTIDQ